LFELITNYLEPFCYLLYTVAFILFVKRDRSVNIWVLLIYYIIGLLLMAYASTLVPKQKNNVWAYNILFLIGSVCMGIYFKKLLKNRLNQAIVIIFILLQSNYFITRNLVFDKLYVFDSFGYSMVSISIIIFSFMYLYEKFKNIDEIKIYYNSHFWIIAGYLLFYIGGFFIFATYYYLTDKIMPTYTYEERVLLTNLWGVHNVLLFLSALTTLTGSLWITFRERSI
jgi:hypothetical protein